MDAVVFQVLCQAVSPHVRVDIPIINHADGLRLVLVDLQLSILETVTIGSESTVPSALPGFLNTSLHGLDADVLPFDFRHGGEHGDHKLPRILGGVDAVLHANQVDPEVLHHL